MLPDETKGLTHMMHVFLAFVQAESVLRMRQHCEVRTKAAHCLSMRGIWVGFFVSDTCSGARCMSSSLVPKSVASRKTPFWCHNIVSTNSCIKHSEDALHGYAAFALRWSRLSIEPHAMVVNTSRLPAQTFEDRLRVGIARPDFCYQ